MAKNFMNILKSNNRIGDKTLALIGKAQNFGRKKDETADKPLEENILDDLDKDEKSASTEQQEHLLNEKTDDGEPEPAPAKPNPFAKLMMGAAAAQNNNTTSEPPKVGLGIWGNLVKKVQKKQLIDEDNEHLNEAADQIAEARLLYERQ